MTKKEVKWTIFWDMHSGGSTKEAPYEKIYIEAPQDEAERIFINRFGHDPNQIACECCGQNYSIDESDSLQEASAYHRNDWGKKKGTASNSDLSPHSALITLDDYIKQKDVLIIWAKDIKSDGRL
jgi:hypothetical protein